MRKTKNMSMRKIFPFLIALFAFPAIINAQVTTANISGNVKDDKGAPLAGATVKVVNTDNGATKFSQTDKGGRFLIVNLDPGGPYTVTVNICWVNHTGKNKCNFTVRYNREFRFYR